MTPYIWGTPSPCQTRLCASTVTEVAFFSSRQVSESTTEGALCILGFPTEGAAQFSVAQLVESLW